jgi:hypothetical protein
LNIIVIQDDANMALPNSIYVECPSLQNYFIDKDTAQAMSGGSVWFYSDVDRTNLVEKPIYQQVRLPDNTYEFVQLNNPVTLSSIGTFADDNGNDINVYLYPFTGLPGDAVRGDPELYYIRVYNSGNVFQFDREAYPPNQEEISGNVPGGNSTNSGNILSNPQFAKINFNPDSITGAFVYHVSGTDSVYNLAPDWDLVTSGTGTVTVKRVDIGDQVAPSNPPYAIDIQCTSLTSLQLRQRIYNDSRLLYGTYVSGYFVAETQDSQLPLLTLYYKPSASTTPTLVQTIAQGATNSTGFTEIFNADAVQIILKNPENADVGYIDIYLDIPVTSHIQVSSFQVVTVPDAASSAKFVSQSTARQIDHIYHDDRDNIFFKPIKSYLVGWDFPLNPTQFGSSMSAKATGANTAYYAWDQTIVFQSVTSGITVDAEADTLDLSLTANATTQMAIIQYLDAYQAQKILADAAKFGLSCNVVCKSMVAQKLTISLWWTAGAAPNIGANASLITALDADGHPSSVVAGWTEIQREPFGNAVFSTGASGTLQSYGFSGFADSSAYLTGKTFAIVIGTSSVLAGNKVVFDSVSLVPGKIPTIPAPQSADEVLRECQYYYEMSYVPGTVISPLGVATDVNCKTEAITAISYTVGASASSRSFASPFELSYKTTKRVAPTARVWDTAGGINNFSASLFYTTNLNAFATSSANIVASSYWTNSSGIDVCRFVPISINYVDTVTPTKNSLGAYVSACIKYQYELDSRIGIV